MYGPATPGDVATYTPDSNGRHGYEFKNGYRNSQPPAPAAADVAAIMNAPITPMDVQGPITPGYGDGYSSRQADPPATADVAAIMNAPITPMDVQGPITPGYGDGY